MASSSSSKVEAAAGASGKKKHGSVSHVTAAPAPAPAPALPAPLRSLHVCQRWEAGAFNPTHWHALALTVTPASAAGSGSAATAASEVWGDGVDEGDDRMGHEGGGGGGGSGGSGGQWGLVVDGDGKRPAHAPRLNGPARPGTNAGAAASADTPAAPADAGTVPGQGTGPSPLATVTGAAAAAWLLPPPAGRGRGDMGGDVAPDSGAFVGEDENAGAGTDTYTVTTRLSAMALERSDSYVEEGKGSGGAAPAPLAPAARGVLMKVGGQVALSLSSFSPPAPVPAPVPAHDEFAAEAGASAAAAAGDAAPLRVVAEVAVAFDGAVKALAVAGAGDVADPCEATGAYAWWRLEDAEWSARHALATVAAPGVGEARKGQEGGFAAPSTATPVPEDCEARLDVPLLLVCGRGETDTDHVCVPADTPPGRYVLEVVDAVLEGCVSHGAVVGVGAGAAGALDVFAGMARVVRPLRANRQIAVIVEAPPPPPPPGA